jgi:hypothetical protein
MLVHQPEVLSEGTFHFGSEAGEGLRVPRKMGLVRSGSSDPARENAYGKEGVKNRPFHEVENLVLTSHRRNRAPGI